MTARGRAGRTGDDVRSDALVTLEIRDRGGLEIELRSRVEPYYGESIRVEARTELERLGVAHARASIDDQGALPFVIQARIEAAARRAGLSETAHAPPGRTVPLPPPSERARPRRSRLYLPGNEPKFMINAGLHGPDGVILDLEDSVHPDEKDAARLLVRNALRALDTGRAERMVRINQLPLGLDDLRAVVPELPDLVLIPKAEAPEQVVEVDRAITGLLGKDAARPVWLMPILESALGVERAFEIASASPRVVALTVGLEDYTADLGVVKTDEGDETLYARLRLVNAARAAAVQAIDSVYSDVADLDGLRAWAERSRRIGFEGMGCIHPRQIRVIHEAFAPSPAELDRARKIVAAFEDAKTRGVAVVSLGSKMIDAPVVERARKLVDHARAVGLLQDGQDEPGTGTR